MNTETQPHNSNEKWYWLFSIPWWGLCVLAFGAIFCLNGLHQLGSVLGFVDPIDETFLNWTLVPTLVLLLISFGLANVSWIGKRIGFGRDTRRPRNARYVKLGSVVFGIGLLIGVIAVAFPAAEAARQAAEDAKDQRWVERSFGEGNFVVTTPESWVIQEDQSGPNGLYLVAARHDLHLIVSAVNRADVTAKSLGELSETWAKQLAGSFKASEITPDVSGSTEFISFRDKFVTASVDGTRLKFVLRHFEAGKFYGELRFWSTPSRFDEHAETAKRVMDSLRIAN